jgi:hypothetical protein
MIIDFPGGARVDAHFGNFTVKTDQPMQGEADTGELAKIQCVYKSDPG